tara:strand:- start:1267 stop:1827 length:561 start_codon:yes stop_codon:yes gene_type:complete
MLNFETTLQDSKSYGDLTLSEVEPILKINLRSNKREFSTKIGKLLSIIPPIEPNTSSGNKDYSILWLSPDEWLVYSNDKTLYKQQNLLEENLFKNISNLNQGAVTNVTDHWVMINLKGSKIYDLLSKSSPYDYKKFKQRKGSVTQTLLNNTDVILHNIDNNNLNLFVRRSFSKDLWLWINDSASFL